MTLPKLPDVVFVLMRDHEWVVEARMGCHRVEKYRGTHPGALSFCRRQFPGVTVLQPHPETMHLPL